MSDAHMNDTTFSRLFIIMILAMTVLSLLLMVVAVFASSDVNQRLDERSELENSDAIIARITPVGTFSADAAAATAVVAAPAEPLTGEQAYSSCAACHAAGIAGAPVLGDTAGWEERLAKGVETLYSNAINGFTGSAGMMPAKGGNVALSDDDVKAAVDYMLEQL